jgi:hypothetical protein
MYQKVDISTKFTKSHPEFSLTIEQTLVDTEVLVQVLAIGFKQRMSVQCMLQM